MQVVAISWHLFQLTKSAFFLGLIDIAGFLPMFLISSVAGILVDVFDSKKIILIDQMILMIINGLFAIATLTHHDSIWIIFRVISLNACFTVIDMPARRSIIPSLVPKDQLIEELNVHTIFRQMAMIIGPAFAGYLLVVAGTGIIYTINAASFLCYFILVLPVVPVILY